ncbi:MerR family transcriptional regulator [Micromonospora sp. CPCC 206060]|uniref:MerR family transcriptional regulator n=1 Tax=Micromonospora sp. CPCC 206060 TaxID=3122406 RepID=UPI002FF2AC67
MHDLISIGELSRQTSLSQKALRIYDARGLLRPACTDERTGFRYYGREEIARSRRIALLRAIGMSLEQVGQVLDAPDGPSAAALVAQYWRHCEHSHHARVPLVAQLQEELMTGTQSTFALAHRTLPEQKVISIHGYADAAALPTFIPQACEELFDLLRKERLPLAGPPFVVFHSLVSEDAPGVVEVCAPTEGVVAPAGRIGVRLEPAHAEVYAAVRAADRSYPSVLGAHHAVAGWLQGHDRALSGPAREIDHPNSLDPTPDALISDVAYPHLCGRACNTLPTTAWPDPRWTDR